MPFIAKIENNKITPEEADEKIDYTCAECNEILRIRRSHTRDGSFVARHFYHKNDSSGCGGESDTHKKMKSIAASKARNLFGDRADVLIEESLDDRRVDVLVRFNEPCSPYGKGICIEVQHKNESKDVIEVEHDYLKRDFSVLWLEEDSYNNYDVDFGSGEFINMWPDGVEKLWKYSFMRNTNFLESGRHFLQDLRGNIAYEHYVDDLDVIKPKLLEYWLLPSEKEYWNNTPWIDRFPFSRESTKHNGKEFYYIHNFHNDLIPDSQLNSEVPADFYYSWYGLDTSTDEFGTTYVCSNCSFEKVLPESPHQDESKRTVRSGCENCGKLMRFVWYYDYRLQLATK